MILRSDVRVFECKEYEEVNLNLADILINGHLAMYPEIASKGYFDVNISDGRLILRSKGWVGLIPLSDSISVHVHSRAPIGNLIYMVTRSNQVPRRISGFLRTYGTRDYLVDSPEILYGEAFLEVANVLLSTAPLKSYVRRQDSQSKRGRLLLSPSCSQGIAKGARHRHLFEVNELTLDNEPNAIVKLTAQRILRVQKRLGRRADERIIRKAHAVIERLSVVREIGLSEHEVVRKVPSLVRSLPARWRYYESALWLSYLIASRLGIGVETFGKAKFDSILIDVASVFEDYVRRICLDASSSSLRNLAVIDGNERPVPLFKNSPFMSKPDIYFRGPSGFIAVADVKYKPNLKAADRYEILGFCNALDVKKAVFVCPRGPNEEAMSCLGQTQSGIEVNVIRMDLSSRHLSAEEEFLHNALAEVIYR